MSLSRCIDIKRLKVGDLVLQKLLIQLKDTIKSKSFGSLGLIVSLTLFAILVRLAGFGLLAGGAFTSADFDITSSTMRGAEQVYSGFCRVVVQHAPFLVIHSPLDHRCRAWLVFPSFAAPPVTVIAFGALKFSRAILLNWFKLNCQY